MIERDETDELSGDLDPVHAALCPLIEYIFAVTTDGSPERAAAMSEVLELPARIRAALRRPRLH